MADDITNRIGEFTSLPSVRVSSSALALTLLINYGLEGGIPSFKAILGALVAVTMAAYFAGLFLGKASYGNFFIIGVLSYYSYIGALLFLKISQEAPSLQETLQPALTFGLICIGVWWFMRNIR